MRSIVIFLNHPKAVSSGRSRPLISFSEEILSQSLPASDRPKTATVFLVFAITASVIIFFSPLLLIQFEGPALPLFALSIAALVLAGNSYVNWRWWTPTSRKTAKEWIFLLLEALPATLISGFIIIPGDLLGYVWVLLVLIVGMLTANIATVLRSRA